jgi:DNA-binding SARP family transcriptional activator/tetratricopeptide (TPR) repeat protein
MLNELHLKLLGNVEVRLDEALVIGFHSNKVQGLLFYLAVTGRPHLRPTLAGLLWGDMPEASARNNLRKALTQLRQLVGSHLSITRQTVAFNRDNPYWLDVERFEGKAGISSAETDIEGLREAVELYRGDFLEGFYVRQAPAFEEWVLARQARLRELALQALHRLSTFYAGQGKIGLMKGIDYTTRLLTPDPWREEAHQQLMLLLAHSGQRSAALAQYEICRQVLAEELGVKPGAETLALYERIRDGEVRAASKEVIPHLPSTATPLSPNLPVTSPARFPSKLVGRTAEMKTLEEVWQRASQAGGQMVLVEGELGIGKTRLVEELLAELFGSATILRVKCPEMSDPLAYTLFVGPLRQALSEDILPRLSDPWLAELSRLLPEIQARYPSLAYPPQLDLATERRRLFDAVGATLHTLTDTQPLILFFDDLHWADGTSLALLNHLADPMREAPVLIIGTFRSNEVEMDHPLHQTQSVWQRLGRLTKLRLSPLTIETVIQLLQELTTWAGDDPSFGELLNRETQGNPLFLVEMIASLRDERRLPQSAEAWRRDFRAEQISIPSQVQTIIEKRLHRLDDLSRRIVTSAAVLRNSFETIMSMNEYSEPEVLAGFETLLRSGLLVEQGGNTLTFSHDKIREVAYHSLSHLRRRWFHQQAAESLQLAYQERTEAVADQLAYHFERAGLKDKAWVYHTLAGHRAKAQYAHEAAVYHYQQAITLAPDRLTAAQVEQQIKLYEGSGEILQALGRYTEADAIYVRIRTTAIAANDTIAQARAWNLLGLTQWWLGDYQAALDSEKHAEAIALEAGEAARIVLIRVLAIKAWALIYLGEIEPALIEAEAAVSLGASFDPPPIPELAESFFVRGRVHLGLKHLAQSAEDLQQVRTYFHKAGQRRKGCEVWAVLAAVVSHLAGYQQGLFIAQEALGEAREIGHLQAAMLRLQFVAIAELRLGQYQEAEAALRQVLALAEASEARYALPETYAKLAEACLRQGRIPEAVELAQHALMLSQKTGQPGGMAKAWWCLGLVAAECGDSIKIAGQNYDATACFTKSQQDFTDAYEELERAWFLRDWAIYELRQGNRSHGQALWQEARGIFEAASLSIEANPMADLPPMPASPSHLPAQFHPSSSC